MHSGVAGTKEDACQSNLATQGHIHCILLVKAQYKGFPGVRNGEWTMVFPCINVLLIM